MFTIKELENSYKSILCEKNFLSVDNLIEIAIDLFKKLKINNLDYSNSYNDMLLFQSGVYDWGDENGKHFSFDITRQIILPEEDEPYQLSMTLIFEPFDFLEIESNEFWNDDFATLEDFTMNIKKTSAYEISKKSTAKRMQFLTSQE